MATLVSPGVSISVIDQSLNVGAGPGTVPLIFIATQQDKIDPTSGTTIAPGTLAANVGKIYSITSQRELVSTFGDPVFYSVSGSSLNGYPLNEYGLLAAYSYLGISNLARVVRADINLAELESTPVAPTSPAAANTLWFDQTASSYGLFERTVVPSSTGPVIYTWAARKPDYVIDYPASEGTGNSPASSLGSDGNIAVQWEEASGIISYWQNTGEGTWTELGHSGGGYYGSGPTVVVQSIWPTSYATDFWIKITEPAQGANIVLRKMSTTTGSFVQIGSPILGDSAAADAYYSNLATGSNGQYFVGPNTHNSTSPNSLIFWYNFGPSDGGWDTGISNIFASAAVPTSGPKNGQLWFNSLLGLNSDGTSTVDLLVNDGTDHWENYHLEGFSTQPNRSTYSAYPQSQDPRDNVPSLNIIDGDLWIQTDVLPYPVIKKWNANAGVWVLLDNTDQTTPNGIIFTDARSNPGYIKTGTTYSGENNGGGNYPDLDPDAPSAALYPKGFTLWNTRYSSNNVKQWQSPYVFDGVTASPDNTNNSLTGRWVDYSGNNPGGVPYMGTEAQQIVITRAIQSVIVSNEDIRAEDLYFNLIAAPGQVAAIDEMLALNDDRKNTAFVVGDTPFTLNATGTALQNWATNTALAYDNGTTGLISASKYFGVWYPSGLGTNTDGTDVVVPPSHMALRTIAYNDQVAYPWFAPAGLQRGVVNNAASVGYVNDSGQYIPVKLNEGQRDILYVNGINPIRTMPAGGIVVFGQKTRQSYSSATDRINVVRLENYLRYQLNTLAQPFLFEPNDTTTRKAVKDAFDRFLSELITLRGLYDFLVVCDLSNNTPARIDRNELWIDIAIQPVKAIEFIYIPIRIKNTGSSLTAN